MSVARAREFIARCRAAGIVVHELGGHENRGNGQSSAYQGFSIHHTATAFGMAPRVLWEGRPDLAPPLCNSAGNADGSITVVADHPANHAGASGGWDTAPLPRTSVFNKLMWGHEIVYPGTVSMTAAQYRTAVIVSKIGVDIWGYGDVNRIKFHQGTSITGKWDPGYASGKTYDIRAFRAAAAAGAPAPTEEDTLALDDSMDSYVWPYTRGSAGDPNTSKAGHFLADARGEAIRAANNSAITNAKLDALTGQVTNNQALVMAAIADDDVQVDLSGDQMQALLAGLTAASKKALSELLGSLDEES